MAPKSTAPEEAEVQFAEWADPIRRLADDVRGLESIAERMGLPPASKQPWHGALFDYLLPRIEERPPMLVVAVTGGTNTGKSTIFNHLVGQSLSRALPLATGTKHPVCVVPSGSEYAKPDSLRQLFPGFTILAWNSDEDALRDDLQGLPLFSREDSSGLQPKRLILLDTPDIDGVLETHWDRATHIRNAADVIVCVLTSQKYNDAAVVKFFREAAEHDKSVFVIFNMIRWPEEQNVCEFWLRTFRDKTGVVPQETYCAPYDAGAAQANRLVFHSLSGLDGNLRKDLSSLRFAETKARSLRGGLRILLEPVQGLQTYLDKLTARASEYAQAQHNIHSLVRDTNPSPPQIPSHLILDPVWAWLAPRRSTFDRVVNGVYSWFGDIMFRPFVDSPATKEEKFRKDDWDSFRKCLTRLLDRLRHEFEIGNDIIREALGPVLSGMNREVLLRDIEIKYRELPLSSDRFREHLTKMLEDFARDNPGTINLITYGLLFAAIVRPTITIACMGVPAHEAFMHFSTQAAQAAAQQALTQATTELANQAAQNAAQQVAAAAAVESARRAAEVATQEAIKHGVTQIAVEATAAVTAQGVTEGTGQAAILALIGRLHAAFYEERYQQLVELLNEHLISPAVLALDIKAGVESSETLHSAQRILEELRQQLAGDRMNS
jgi:methylmalonyl-CoA mutase cobalamin-binding subunit